MKRGEFLKELAGSLAQTVKSAYEPFIEEDLEKFEGAADRLLGITWIPMAKETELQEDLEMKFANGKPFIVYRNGTHVQVIDGICPECTNLITVTALYSTGKCFNCQKEYNFKENLGDLKLVSLPLKVKDGMYLVGFTGERSKVKTHA